MCNNIYESIKESDFLPSFPCNLRGWNWHVVSKREKCCMFIYNFISYDKVYLRIYLFSKFLILLCHSTEAGILLKNSPIYDSRRALLQL